MSYIRDLDFCDYFENDPPYKYGYKNVLAVGWLDKPAAAPFAMVRDFDYISKGAVPAGFFDKLKQLIETRHEFIQYCGHHDCAYCDEWGGQGQAFIPGKEVVYACPIGILHYIEAHNYCPPKEFIDAVMRYEGTLSGTDYMKRLKDIDERLYWMLEKQTRPWDKQEECEYPWTKEWDRAVVAEERRRIAQMTEKERQYEERSKIRLPHNDLVDALKKEFSKNFFR